MNVLLTSAGRRSYLVEYFKEALLGVGKVFCSNMFAHSAAMYAADLAFTTPPAYDPQYVTKILSICRDNDVGMLCPLHDLDLYILSQHQEEIQRAGIIAILPTQEWGQIALDKYACTLFLKENGFAVPWTTIDFDDAVNALAKKKIVFPVVVKARMGFGSQGLKVCHDFEELKSAYHDAQKQIREFETNKFTSCPLDQSVVIQQGISGKEYCIDIINDLSGQYASAFMLEVHAMRAGETDMVTTRDIKLAGDLPLRLSRFTKHIGIWGIDFMDDNGILKIIDINPRFTGDYPFHHLAGANIPAALIAWAENRQVKPEWLTSRPEVHAYKDLVPKIFQRSTH